MKRIILLVLIPLSAMAAPPTGTFNITPTGTVSPVTANASWNITGAVSCVATAVPVDAQWNGPVAVSGTKQLLNITANTTYSLNCATASHMTVTLNWTAPTQNTDGSALTDLAGFKIYQKDNAGNYLLTSTINSPTILTQNVNTAIAGVYTFAATAFNAGGTESDRTGDVLATTTASEAATFTQAVTVAKKPKAPALTATVP